MKNDLSSNGWKSYPGCDCIWIQNRNGTTIPDTWRTLDRTTALLFDSFIQSGQRIEMETSKVQFSQISGIVHVSYEDINILTGAESLKTIYLIFTADTHSKILFYYIALTINTCLIRYFGLFAKHFAQHDSKYKSNKIIHVPDNVQNQKDC